MNLRNPVQLLDSSVGVVRSFSSRGWRPGWHHNRDLILLSFGEGSGQTHGEFADMDFRCETKVAWVLSMAFP